MVVCKFFQQGSCRYGQSCRFEHAYSSKYTYHAPQLSPVQAPATNPTVTDEQLMNQVQSDVQSALRGNQWLLSSYAPFKDKPALPGLQDLSFEEARLFIYEALSASNNVDQAVAYMNNLFIEAKQKHEKLLQPNPIIINTLRHLYNGEIPTSPFQNVQTNLFGGNSSNTDPTSLFRNAIQGSQNSTSIFSQSPDNSAAKSLFAQAANQHSFGSQPSQNVFASQNSVFGSQTQNNQSVFGSPTQNHNVFASNTDQAKSIFAQAASQNSQNQNAFSNINQSANPASIFASANHQVSDPFGQKSSPFQINNQPPSSQLFGNSNFDQVSDDDQTYSKLEDLMREDLDAFQRDSFQLGFVPDVPPPKALCV